MDSQNLLIGLLGTVLALIGVGLATSLDDTVDRVIRAVAIGSFLGTGVAYRRHLRRPDLDPFPIITRWSYVGLVIELLFEAGRS
jgi:hypothetical protein